MARFPEPQVGLGWVRTARRDLIFGTSSTGRERNTRKEQAPERSGACRSTSHGVNATRQSARKSDERSTELPGNAVMSSAPGVSMDEVCS